MKRNETDWNRMKRNETECYKRNQTESNGMKGNETEWKLAIFGTSFWCMNESKDKAKEIGGFERKSESAPKVASNKKSAFLVRSGWNFNRTELSLIRFERANKIGNFGIFGSFARIKVTFAEIWQSPHFLTKHRLNQLLMKPQNRPLGAPPPLPFAAGAFFLAKCFA